MAPNPIYFEIVDASGGYRAHVRSTLNHKLIWWTEVYERKDGARNAIGLLKLHASTAEVKDMTASARLAS